MGVGIMENIIINQIINNHNNRKMEKIKEISQYYRDLRKWQYENNVSLTDKAEFDKYYPILQKLFKVLMIISFRPVKIHKDLRVNNSNRPKIYAVTHIGRYDIEASFITKNEQAVYLWGDPGDLYLSPEKKIIDKVGAVFIDTDYRDDCNIGLETIIRYLKAGTNTQIYPEGAWNIIENKAVMRCYDGAVIAAIEGEADIIPVAIQDYGRKIYVSYGESIDVSNMTLENVKEGTALLRDVLATLKWELIEEYSGKKKYCGDSLYTVKRSKMAKNARAKFFKSILKNAAHGYGYNEIEKTRYKDKNNPEPEYVFDPLYNKLEIKKETAFIAKEIVLAKKLK